MDNEVLEIIAAIIGLITVIVGGGAAIQHFNIKFTGKDENHDNVINNYYNTDSQKISGKVTYKAETKFEYSTDSGSTWKERMMEFNVGFSYYMMISMKVTQSQSTDDDQIIHAVITVPDTDAERYVIKEIQGTKNLIGNKDFDNHTVTYPIDIVPSVSPSEISVIFECIPFKEGDASVSVSYDETIPEIWDKTVILKYVD